MERGISMEFDDWTGGRTPLVVGTNAGSPSLAFQNWRKFKEAFVPELIGRAVNETSEILGRKVERCLDPFAGSGTTPLACQFLGVEPIAIEVNPFLADLVEAKLTVVETGKVARRCAEVLSSSNDIDPTVFYAAGPKTFVEPGVKGRFLFTEAVARRLASLAHAIQCIGELDVQRLLRVLLASASMEVCNAQVSGKGRRYRRNWQTKLKTPDDLDRAFLNLVEAAIYDIARHSNRPLLDYHLLRGDARNEIENVGQIDLAVFSPPYPNSFDYTDVYNVELWAAGYLKNQSENRVLREATLRSHVQIKRSFASSQIDPCIADVTNRLRNVDGLWNKNIPDMVEGYFDDLVKILSVIRAKMQPGARVYMVVGDSKYGGIDVPVADILTKLAARLSFTVQRQEPFRSMRASPQQGGRAELPETLIIFEAA